MTFMLLETGLRSEPSGKNCFDMLVYSCTDQNLKMLSVAIQILFTVWYIPDVFIHSTTLTSFVSSNFHDFKHDLLSYILLNSVRGL